MNECVRLLREEELSGGCYVGCRQVTNTEHWLVCEHPERPPDGRERWHYQSCHACHVAALAVQRRGSMEHAEFLVGITKPWEPIVWGDTRFVPITNVSWSCGGSMKGNTE